MSILDAESHPFWRPFWPNACWYSIVLRLNHVETKSCWDSIVLRLKRVENQSLRLSGDSITETHLSVETQSCWNSIMLRLNRVETHSCWESIVLRLNRVETQLCWNPIVLRLNRPGPTPHMYNHKFTAPNTGMPTKKCSAELEQQLPRLHRRSSSNDVTSTESLRWRHVTQQLRLRKMTRQTRMRRRCVI